MRKTINREWLESENACEDGIAWWEEHGDESVDITLSRIHTKPEYARWLVEHLLTDKPMALRLAVFSARSCLHNCDGDNAPLIKVIETAEAVLENDCMETRSAAWSATRIAAESEEESAAESAAEIAVWSAARYAAESAAWSVESAYQSAARSARSASRSAYSAAQSAAWSDAWSGAESAAWREILDELIRLRRKEEGEQDA